MLGVCAKGLHDLTVHRQDVVSEEVSRYRCVQYSLLGLWSQCMTLIKLTMESRLLQALQWRSYRVKASFPSSQGHPAIVGMDELVNNNIPQIGSL